MTDVQNCRDRGVQIWGARVFHHPRCGHVSGNTGLRRPQPDAVIAMCCFGRWMEDER